MADKSSDARKELQQSGNRLLDRNAAMATQRLEQIEIQKALSEAEKFQEHKYQASIHQRMLGMKDLTYKTRDESKVQQFKNRLARNIQSQKLLNSKNPEEIAYGVQMALGSKNIDADAATWLEQYKQQASGALEDDIYARSPRIGEHLDRVIKQDPSAKIVAETLKNAIRSGNREQADAAQAALIGIEKKHGIKSPLSYWQEYDAQFGVNSIPVLGTYTQAFTNVYGQAKAMGADVELTPFSSMSDALDRMLAGKDRRMSMRSLTSAGGWAMDGGFQSNEARQAGAKTGSLTDKQKYKSEDMYDWNKSIGENLSRTGSGLLQLGKDFVSNPIGTTGQVAESVFTDPLLATYLVGAGAARAGSHGVTSQLSRAGLKSSSYQIANIGRQIDKIEKWSEASRLGRASKILYEAGLETAGGAGLAGLATSENAVQMGYTDDRLKAFGIALTTDLTTDIMMTGGSMLFKAKSLLHNANKPKVDADGKPIEGPTATPEQTLNDFAAFMDAPEVKAETGEFIVRGFQDAQPTSSRPKFSELKEDATDDQKLNAILQDYGFSQHNAKQAATLARSLLDLGGVGTNNFIKVNDQAITAAWDGLGVEGRDTYLGQMGQVIDSINENIKDPVVKNNMIEILKARTLGSFGPQSVNTKALKATFEQKFKGDAKNQFRIYAGREARAKDIARRMTDLSFDADVWTSGVRFKGTDIEASKQMPFNLSELPKPNESFTAYSRVRALRDMGLSSADIRSVMQQEGLETIADLPPAFVPVHAFQKFSDSLITAKDIPSKGDVLAKMRELYSEMENDALALNRIEEKGSYRKEEGIQSGVDEAKRLRSKIDSKMQEYTELAKEYHDDGVDFGDVVVAQKADADDLLTDLRENASEDIQRVDAYTGPVTLQGVLGVSDSAALTQLSKGTIASDPSIMPELENAVAIAEDADPGITAAQKKDILERSDDAAQRRLQETGSQAEGAKAADTVQPKFTREELIRSSQYHNKLLNRLGDRDELTVIIGGEPVAIQKTEDGILITASGQATLVDHVGTYMVDGDTFALDQNVQRLIQRMPMDSSSIRRVLGLNDSVSVDEGLLADAANDLNQLSDAYYSALDSGDSALIKQTFDNITQGAVDISDRINLRLGDKSARFTMSLVNGASSLYKGLRSSSAVLSKNLETGVIDQKLLAEYLANVGRVTESSLFAFGKEKTKAFTQLFTEMQKSPSIDNLKKLDQEIQNVTGVSYAAAGDTFRMGKAGNAVLHERIELGEIAMTHPISFILGLSQETGLNLVHSPKQMKSMFRKWLKNLDYQNAPIKIPNVNFLGAVQRINFYHEAPNLPGRTNEAGRSGAGWIQVKFKVSDSQLANVEGGFTTGYGQAFFSLEDIARATVDRDFVPRPVWDLGGTTLAPTTQTLDGHKGVTTSFTNAQYDSNFKALTSKTGNISALSVYDMAKNGESIPAIVNNTEGVFKVVQFGPVKQLVFEHSIPAKGKNLTATYPINLHQWGSPEGGRGADTKIGAGVKILANVERSTKTDPAMLHEALLDQTDVKAKPTLGSNEPSVEGRFLEGERQVVGVKTKGSEDQVFAVSAVLDASRDNPNKPSVILYGATNGSTVEGAGPVYIHANAKNDKFTETAINVMNAQVSFDGKANIGIVTLGSYGANGRLLTYGGTKSAFTQDLFFGTAPDVVVLIENVLDPEIIEAASKAGYVVAGSHGTKKLLVKGGVEAKTEFESKEQFNAVLYDHVQKIQAQSNPNLQPISTASIVAKTSSQMKPIEFKDSYSAPDAVNVESFEGAVASTMARSDVKPGDTIVVSIGDRKISNVTESPADPILTQDAINYLMGETEDLVDVDGVPASALLVRQKLAALGAQPNGAPSRKFNPKNMKISFDVQNGEIVGFKVIAKNFDKADPMAVVAKVKSEVGKEVNVIVAKDLDDASTRMKRKTAVKGNFHVVEFESAKKPFAQSSTLDLFVKSDLAVTPQRKTVSTSERVIRSVAATPGEIQTDVNNAVFGDASEMNIKAINTVLQKAKDSNLSYAELQKLISAPMKDGRSLMQVSTAVAQLYRSLGKEELQFFDEAGNAFTPGLSQIMEQFATRKMDRKDYMSLKPEDKSVVDGVVSKLAKDFPAQDWNNPAKKAMIQNLLSQSLKTGNPNVAKGFTTKEMLGVVGAIGLIASAVPAIAHADIEDDEVSSILGKSVLYLGIGAAVALAGGRAIMKGGKIRKLNVGSEAFAQKAKQSIQQWAGEGSLLKDIFIGGSAMQLVESVAPAVASAMNTASLKAHSAIINFREDVGLYHQKVGLTENDVNILITDYQDQFTRISKLTGVNDPRERIRQAVGTEEANRIFRIAGGAEPPTMLDPKLRSKEQAMWVANAMVKLAENKINFENLPGSSFTGSSATKSVVNGAGFDKQRLLEMFHGVDNEVDFKMMDWKRLRLGVDANALDSMLENAMRDDNSQSYLDHASNLMWIYHQAGGQMFKSVQKKMFEIAKQKHIAQTKLSQTEIDSIANAKMNEVLLDAAGQITVRNHKGGYTFLPKALGETKDGSGNPIIREVNTLANFLTQFEVSARASYGHSELHPYQAELGLVQSHFLSTAKDDKMLDIWYRNFEGDTGINLAEMFDPDARNVSMSGLTDTKLVGNLDTFQYLTRLATDVTRAITETAQSTISIMTRNGLIQTGKAFGKSMPVLNNLTEHEAAVIQALLNQTTATLQLGIDQQAVLTYSQKLNQSAQTPQSQQRISLMKMVGAGILREKMPIMIDPTPKARALFGMPLKGKVNVWDVMKGHVGLRQFYSGVIAFTTEMAFHAGKMDFEDAIKDVIARGDKAKMSQTKLRKVLNEREYQKAINGQLSFEERYQAQMRYAEDAVRSATGARGLQSETTNMSYHEAGKYMMAFKRAPAKIMYSTFNDVVIPAIAGDTKAMANLAASMGFGYLGYAQLMAFFGLNDEQQSKIADENNQAARWFGYMSMNAASLPMMRLITNLAYGVTSNNPMLALQNQIVSTLGANVSTAVNLGTGIAGPDELSTVAMEQFSGYKNLKKMLENGFVQTTGTPYNVLIEHERGRGDAITDYIAGNLARFENGKVKNPLRFPLYLLGSNLRHDELKDSAKEYLMRTDPNFREAVGQKQIGSKLRDIGRTQGNDEIEQLGKQAAKAANPTIDIAKLRAMMNN